MKKNKKITFLILHYLTGDDTIKCIDSILKLYSENMINVVVVDNASHNNSIEVIKEKYANNEIVTIISSKKNIGFAKGNNLGFIYAKYTLKSDYIIMINNDTYFEDIHFIEKMHNIYIQTGYYILGPDILSEYDNSHQNPVSYSLASKKTFIKRKRRLKVYLLMNYLGIDNVVHWVKKIFGKRKKESIDYNKRAINVQLHGSCLIFSDKYIEKYDGLYDKTFMYMEEEILYYQMTKNKELIIYDPSIQIIHKEDSSTDMLFSKDRLKRRFKYKNVIISMNELIKMMD